MKLTEIQCKTSKPKDKSYKLSDGLGMYMEVMPNGSKYWRLKYRYQQKEKRLALGVYPEISLKQARDRRAEARRLLDEGKDPSLERKRQKVLSGQSNENTFEAIAREWHENRKDQWQEKYANDILNRLEQDIFPQLGAYPITEIEPPFLLQVIRSIESRGAHELAKRQLQKCGEIFRYAIATGRASRDPSHDIRDALKPAKSSHFAALDVEELPGFLRALERNDARLYETTRNAIQLMMLTFVRTSELINAEWAEIDWERKEWRIPAHRMKMKKEHIVPLSRQALEILERQSEKTKHWPLVFPSLIKPKQSISNNTILGAIRRLGYKGKMTGHGFRALAMSAIKQELGYRHEVVDRQLAHQPRNKIDRAYDRALFLDERRIMMQEWADYIDSLINKNNVVSLSAKRISK